MEAEIRKKHQEEQKLRERVEADKRENKDRIVRESKAVDRCFGTKVTRYGDIGVDLNKKGG